MKVEKRIEVAATPAEAFSKMSDPRLLGSLMTGIMDWYPTAEPNRFRTVTHMGPAPLGGEIELEFWPESGMVTWHSTRGIYQMARFLVRKRDIGSEVVLRVYWHLDGGIFSRLTEWITAMTVAGFAEEALQRLRGSIEAQPPKRRRRLAVET